MEVTGCMGNSKDEIEDCTSQCWSALVVGSNQQRGFKKTPVPPLTLIFPEIHINILFEAPREMLVHIQG